MDGVTALDRSYDHLTRLMANLSAEQLVAPCPCSEWDVRAMLNHTLGAAWMFTLVNQGQAVGPEDAGDVLGDDPAKAAGETAEANVGSWRGPDALEGERTYPFGTFPASAALMVNVGEIALHAWDLARATGQDETIDPEVVSAIDDFYRAIPLDAYRAYGAFGPEVSVPDAASAQDRLLAYTGRRP
jgi:uncharacterized protein (TIGR03086 family)